MNHQPARIVRVEDDPVHTSLVGGGLVSLARGDRSPDRSGHWLREGFKRIAKRGGDVVLLNLHPPDAR